MGALWGLLSIRETLKGIVDDAAVLERVRTQAAKLMEMGSIEK